MLKSVQIKIVLIFMIIGILMLGLQGVLFSEQLQEISTEIVKNSELEEMLVMQVKRTQFLTISLIIVFTIISILVGIFVAKVIISPIAKLTKSAEQVAKGGQYQIKYLNDGKNKTEVDELTKAFGMMHDELNENLKEVSRQKKQIETILLHMSDGILAFNINGEIIHKNRAADKLFALNGKETNFDEIFSKIDADINLEKIIYLENWTSTQAKVIVGEKTLNLFFAGFRDEAERPGGAIVVIQDITEHVKLDTMRTEFVADVSHELKTPLTSVLGYAETLANSDYDAELQEKFLGVITSETIRMTKLVNDLLTLSKYDDTTTKWEKSEFDLGKLVKKCQENLQIEANKKKQKLECFITSNVPPVYADKDGIERVVLNILSNSIKYTDDGGNIKIYVGFVYNDAYIKIIDNGIGIPQKDLDRIFERFYRVDKARTRKMGGTGLRISYCKRSFGSKQW